MIIKASRQHAELLSKLGRETFYRTHLHSAPAYELESYMKMLYSPDVIRKELANPGNIYHIISHENHVAGFSKMALDKKHNAIPIVKGSKMEQIYLLHSFQGLKLGFKLLTYNVDYSKSLGQSGMWLIVWVENTTAITFYQKFGFHVVSREDFRLTDTHLNPSYVMFLDYERY